MIVNYAVAANLPFATINRLPFIPQCLQNTVMELALPKTLTRPKDMSMSMGESPRSIRTLHPYIKKGMVHIYKDVYFVLVTILICHLERNISVLVYYKIDIYNSLSL
jgi:hypothetical protein